MRYPEFLREGGSIGFIAPSFGEATEPYASRFDNALKIFKEAGYKTVEGPNCRLSKGIGKSNTPEKCAEEINDFFINSRSDIIVSVGGGELMCEDMPFVDFEAIKNAKPKWFIGYSDNTNLTFLLPTLCDTAAIYGPCVTDFGMRKWHPAINDAFSLLKGEKLSFTNYDGWEEEGVEKEGDYLAPFNITEPYKQIIAWKEKEASFSGRLIGGCMDVLSVLLGTKFDKTKDFLEKYKDDGFIWFLESCDLNVMSIRRSLWQMENAGWFKYVKGFLIGRPYNYKDEFDGFNCHDAVTGILEKYNVPIIMDVDLGHLSPMIPIVSGGFAKVSAKENDLKIDMELK